MYHQVRDHKILVFSPRKRRCFCYALDSRAVDLVFSAQAEVFLFIALVASARYSFLRASGGVSGSGAIVGERGGFSPRKRRCFPAQAYHRRPDGVFSAQAEVFPKELH